MPCTVPSSLQELCPLIITMLNVKYHYFLFKRVKNQGVKSVGTVLQVKQSLKGNRTPDDSS